MRVRAVPGGFVGVLGVVGEVLLRVQHREAEAGEEELALALGGLDRTVVRVRGRLRLALASRRPRLRNAKAALHYCAHLLLFVRTCVRTYVRTYVQRNKAVRYGRTYV